MIDKKLRIVFMGTPEFAVPTLKTLHESEHEVAAVITSVDKLGGRGKKQLIQSAVKKFAEANSIPVLQPKNLKSVKFQEKLRNIGADIQVVVAFRMLPVAVWDMPPLGTINIHGSLLPSYRGAAPIHWAVMNGDKVTGLTTFKLKHEIDTGDMIHQVKVKIEADDTTGSVHDKLMMEGGPLILKTLEDIAAGTVEYLKQNEGMVSKAPKIFRETCQLNFDKTAQQLHNQVRGLNPFPGAFLKITDKIEMKILKSEVDEESDLEIKRIETDNKSYVKIGAAKGALHCLTVQLSGKKRMDIKDLLNGYKFENGSSVL